MFTARCHHFRFALRETRPRQPLDYEASRFTGYSHSNNTVQLTKTDNNTDIQSTDNTGCSHSNNTVQLTKKQHMPGDDFSSGKRGCQGNTFITIITIITTTIIIITIIIITIIAAVKGSCR